MICRVELFQWKENSREAAEACADQMVKQFAEYPGAKNIAFIGHYDKDIYGFASIWESEETADKAKDLIQADILTLFEGYIIDIIKQRQYDVYVPNAVKS